MTKGGKFLSPRVLIAAVIALAVVACTAERPAETPPSKAIRIAPGLALALPKPSELGRSLEASQLVTAHYGGQTFAFEGHVSATPERVLLVGLDTMGRRAVTVEWTEQGFRAERAPWLPEQLRPENMLADMVILYWPEAILRRALGPSGGGLAAGARFRSISADGKEVIRADYSAADPWNGKLTFSNFAWDYELDVQSVETHR